jgi:hypothetical protein
MMVFGLPINTTYTIDFAQVQLCAGDVELPFQPHHIADEEARCRRYCQALGGTTAFEVIGTGHVISSSQARIYVPLAPRGRTTPSIASSGSFVVETTSTVEDATTISIDTSLSSPRLVVLTVTVGASSLNVGDIAILRASDANARIIFDMEL